MAIIWDTATGLLPPHTDTVEMSGRRVSLIVHYGVDETGRLVLERMVIWPTLRTIPNNTHASLRRVFSLEESSPAMRVNGQPLSPERPSQVRLDGLLTIRSTTAEGLEITRTVFPSPARLAALETWWIENASGHALDLEIDNLDFSETQRGTKGIYLLDVSHTGAPVIRLQSGETYTFGLAITARGVLDPLPWPKVQPEEDARRDLVSRLRASLRLECPDPVLERMFDFAKLRAAESIYDTAGGLMHSPGGGAYYAAVWCNDQCEYANPFFPFIADRDGNLSALNSFRLYRHFMGPDYQPIPSSIIAEGADIWEGAGDRGDAAMYAYGASRFSLALGSPAVAAELWPAIEWCLEYCRRKLTPDGVVASDSDELEGRFSHGKTNLATSSLYYGGLRSAAALARALSSSTRSPGRHTERTGRKPEDLAPFPKYFDYQPDDLTAAAESYDRQAVELEAAIEKFFGATISGYLTYRYHEGMELLRSWICLPLVMGIRGREAGTAAALFSPELWTEDGLRTQAGEVTFWDRSTLYGLRSAFVAGETGCALEAFQAYSRRRLLGEHVPYPVEAYPEGNQRHLAAESALYCRVVTEGLFGITPTGFDTFTCLPRLPQGWERMALRSVMAFGRDFDLCGDRDHGGVHIRVVSGGKAVWEQAVTEGEPVVVKLGE
jgi:hypothetical protein